MEDSTYVLRSPHAVAAQAKEVLKDIKKVEVARDLFQNTAFQWTEDYQQMESSNSNKQETLLAIVDLWCAFANMECDIRQFKQATKVYESAVSCPVAGSDPKLWISYAAFCTERKKLGNAQKVFIRALEAVDEEKLGELWMAFLQFAKDHLDKSMTMHKLKATVEELKLKRASGAASTPSPVPIDTSTSDAPNDPSQGHSTPSLHPSALEESENPENPSQKELIAPLGSEPVSVSMRGAEQKPSTPLTQKESKHTSEGTPLRSVEEQTSVTCTSQDVAETQGKSVGTQDKNPESDQISTEQSGNENSTAAEALHVKSSESGWSTKKRSREPEDNLDQKRVKTETEEIPKPSIELPSSTTSITSAGKSSFITGIPTIVPLTATTPSLLFTPLPEEEEKEVDSATLDSLSDALNSQEVFQTILSMKECQLKKDRKLLYQWQDLLATQMHQGCELHRKHKQENSQAENEPDVALRHQNERNKFLEDCAESQKEFLMLSKAGTFVKLEQQQIKMKGMGLPLMDQTRDPEKLTMQRAIVSLIVEAAAICQSGSNSVEKSQSQPQPQINTTNQHYSPISNQVPGKYASPDSFDSSSQSRPHRNSSNTTQGTRKFDSHRRNPPSARFPTSSTSKSKTGDFQQAKNIRIKRYTTVASSQSGRYYDREALTRAGTDPAHATYDVFRNSSVSSPHTHSQHIEARSGSPLDAQNAFGQGVIPRSGYLGPVGNGRNAYSAPPQSMIREQYQMNPYEEFSGREGIPQSMVHSRAGESYHPSQVHPDYRPRSALDTYQATYRTDMYIHNSQGDSSPSSLYLNPSPSPSQRGTYFHDYTRGVRMDGSDRNAMYDSQSYEPPPPHNQKNSQSSHHYRNLKNQGRNYSSQHRSGHVRHRRSHQGPNGNPNVYHGR